MAREGNMKMGKQTIILSFHRFIQKSTNKQTTERARERERGKRKDGIQQARTIMSNRNTNNNNSIRDYSKLTHC